MANHHFFSGDLSGLTMPFSMATTAAATTTFSFALPWTDQPEDSSAAAHLDSAFSFVASCPANGGLPQDGEDAAIGDLIGRLGSICNGGGTSNAASSYSTALSTAPRGAHAGQTLAGSPARRGYGGLLDVRMLPRASSSKSMALENAAQLEAAVATPSDLQENADGEANARKRKAPAKGEAKEASLAMALTAEADASQKRPKHDGDIREESAATEVMDEESYGNGNGSGKAAPEPPRDYIHVRARRGQATDSHSLAERVRRERISERMKMLQSLVPGCNKITGKAVMLDEIINYVHSLQRQVEFLSMELATMNTQFGCNGVPYHQPKDVDMEQKALPVYPSKNTAAELSYAGMPARYNLVSAASVHHGPNHRDAFQVATFLEQDLQSVVQMGIIHKSQEAGTSLPGYYGQAPVNHMKVEP